MIASFFHSWALFHNTYLVGWLVGLLLSLIGVLVVARDQLFLGAAVSEASTLGIALALGVGMRLFGEAHPWIESDGFLSTMAVIFSVAAALLTSRGGGTNRESREAITGWVFLLSASASVLLVAHSPHGLEEIQRLLSSSIIGASTFDVALYACAAAGAAIFIGVFRQRLMLLTMDPAMAGAVGMNTRAWEAATSIILGLAVGLAIRTSGMLYTFGCLTLPALAAKNLCREVEPMWLVSPVLALATSTAGFIIANYYDFPPAQMTVALLAGVVVVSWLTRDFIRDYGR
jgi:ABC-type Mn2+/Zn2+ transport system permease subunit